MRTAVFSDVHGNLVALEAFVEDARRRAVDAYVCLGDALQGGAQPRECLDLLTELECPVVLGNADAFLIDLDPGAEPATEEQLEVARWSREQLGPDGVEHIRGFAPTVSVDLGAGRTLLGMHGSPSSYDEILLPSTAEDDVRRALAGVEADVVAGGHVHMQWARPIAQRILLNPGSVGLPYDHEQERDAPRVSPWAEYALVTSEANAFAIELRRIPVSRAAVVAAIARSGRPHGDVFARGWRD